VADAAGEGAGAERGGVPSKKETVPVGVPAPGWCAVTRGGESVTDWADDRRAVSDVRAVVVAA